MNLRMLKYKQGLTNKIEWVGSHKHFDGKFKEGGIVGKQIAELDVEIDALSSRLSLRDIPIYNHNTSITDVLSDTIAREEFEAMLAAFNDQRVIFNTTTVSMIAERQYYGSYSDLVLYYNQEGKMGTEYVIRIEDRELNHMDILLQKVMYGLQQIATTINYSITNEQLRILGVELVMGNQRF